MLNGINEVNCDEIIMTSFNVLCNRPRILETSHYTVTEHNVYPPSWKYRFFSMIWHVVKTYSFRSNWPLSSWCHRFPHGGYNRGWCMLWLTSYSNYNCSVHLIGFLLFNITPEDNNQKWRGKFESFSFKPSKSRHRVTKSDSIVFRCLSISVGFFSDQFCVSKMVESGISLKRIRHIQGYCMVRNLNI